MHIVFGGAFNPPQLAHYNLVKYLLKKYPSAKVIVLPVGDDYKKLELISFNHRFEMLKLMFKNEKNVIISNLESKLKFNGTIASLNELSKTYDNISLVIGSDHINTLNKWIKYEELLTKYPLIIMQRNNDDVSKLMEQYKELEIDFKTFKFKEAINSTLIRKNPNKYQNWLNQDVYNYIFENNLYEVKKHV